MPYVACPECGLRTYLVRKDHCPRCDAPLRAPAYARPPEDWEADAILPALALARRELTMDAVFVGEMDDARETVLWAVANGWPSDLQPGASWPISESICRRLLDGRIEGAVADVLDEPALRDISKLKGSGLRAWLGVQVPAERARLYVLCCMARERRPELGAGELNVLRGVSATVRAALSSTR
jgi:GAF domain-containing protein